MAYLTFRREDVAVGEGVDQARHQVFMSEDTETHWLILQFSFLMEITNACLLDLQKVKITIYKNLANRLMSLWLMIVLENFLCLQP